MSLRDIEHLKPTASHQLTDFSGGAIVGRRMQEIGIEHVTVQLRTPLREPISLKSSENPMPLFPAPAIAGLLSAWSESSKIDQETEEAWREQQADKKIQKERQIDEMWKKRDAFVEKYDQEITTDEELKQAPPAVDGPRNLQ